MTIEERETDFKNKVNRLISFPYEVRQEFNEYWTEKNKSGTKMRFELERTWDLNRRLTRWANTGFKDKMIGSQKQAVNGAKIAPVASTIKEIAELDRILAIYQKHPTEIPFLELGKWFEYMKENKLLRPLPKDQIRFIQDSYPDDNFKCRCACVELTLKWYTDTNFTFSNVMEARLKLA